VTFEHVNDIPVERGPMYVSTVTKCSFGSVIFEVMKKSRLVRNPMNASNVESPTFVLVALRNMCELMQETIPNKECKKASL
jgi:hypothetical protein